MFVHYEVRATTQQIWQCSQRVICSLVDVISSKVGIEQIQK